MRPLSTVIKLLVELLLLLMLLQALVAKSGELPRGGGVVRVLLVRVCSDAGAGRRVPGHHRLVT